MSIMEEGFRELCTLTSNNMHV